MNCKICNSDACFFAEAKILFKYKIKYFKCESCGFIQTEKPYWLEEAYSEAINESDIGLLKRNIEITKVTRAVIKTFFGKKGKYMDYGGGYGIFVRLMRDSGFDFYWYDKCCKNLFAGGFEAVTCIEQEKKQFELLTANEVFEHLEEPIGETEKMLDFSTNIFFTTELIPKHYPKPDEWWYYATDHGQHISLYSLNSLKAIAKRFKLNLYTNGKNYHLLTSKKLISFIYKIITFPYIPDLLNPVTKRKSFHDDDYEKAIGKISKR
ncbi:MAG: class I SAM-dependent methyltransferase [Ignavibacteria bacterium]|nr:class I SAM-dependent methyltransferase [Ignavibacteria bacterium]